MKIAIIPARGRSKRIKKKNIKIFRGRPIIEWIFEIVKSYTSILLLFFKTFIIPAMS